MQTGCISATNDMIPTYKVWCCFHKPCHVLWMSGSGSLLSGAGVATPKTILLLLPPTSSSLVALPRSLQTLLLLLQPFPPLHDLYLSLLQLLAVHQPHGCFPSNLLLTWVVARMKPRMVSLAAASALLLNSSDGLSFWLGVRRTTLVNQSYLTRMLYNYMVILMLMLSDGFSKALLIQIPPGTGATWNTTI